jgi:hypothetical protein
MDGMAGPLPEPGSLVVQQSTLSKDGKRAAAVIDRKSQLQYQERWPIGRGVTSQCIWLRLA